MANLPADEVIRMALQIAKHVPEDAYGEILEQSLEDINKKACQNQGVDILSSVEQLREAIQDGQYRLTWSYDEYNDSDWYGDDEALWDRDHLGPELERYLRAAMEDVKYARYEEAILLLDALFSIEFEIEDYDTASLESLFEQLIINLDYEETLRQYAYAVMMHCRDHERLSRLFEIEGFLQHSLTLQDIEDVGPKPFPDRDVFAEQWVQYLLEQDLTQYQALIIDAVTYQGGIEALKAFVLAHGAIYSKAYIHLLEIYLSARRFEDAIQIIEDGLIKISGINPYRVKMADMLAEIGRATDNESLYRRGVAEAFHASVDIEHFLPLFDLRDEALLAQAMRHLDAQHGAQTDKSHPYDYYYIHFLHGDYSLVFETCRKDAKALGWRCSVKGKLMPLFVALLAGANTMGRCTK